MIGLGRIIICKAHIKMKTINLDLLFPESNFNVLSIKVQVDLYKQNYKIFSII